MVNIELININKRYNETVMIICAEQMIIFFVSVRSERHRDNRQNSRLRPGHETENKVSPQLSPGPCLQTGRGTSAQGSSHQN